MMGMTRSFFRHPSLILPFLALATAMLACAQISPTLKPPATSAIPAATATASPMASPLATPTVPVTASAVTPAESAPLPAILAQVDLGLRFEQPLEHAVALDVDNGRIFIGAPPDKTLVLSSDTLRIADTLSPGGGLAIDRVRKRLFVGAPGGVVTFDLDSLRPVGTIPITADLFGSTPIADESSGALFVIHNGIYVASSSSLVVTARISGTFPISSTVMGPFAADAALDGQNHRLYVSLNNGIPGSNNGNTLMIYDLSSATTIYQDNERSIVSLKADESSGRLFLTRSRMNNSSFSILDGIKPALRINGIAGSVQVDARRGRVYIADSGQPGPRLLVLDATTGALIADVPLPGVYTLAAFDVQADRLYFLSPDGHLLVMSGHGAAVPTSQPFETSSVLTGSVAWVAPSPNFADDRTVFAAWSPEDGAGGLFGSVAGQLLASTDGGATWGRVRGGLPPYLLVNALAFSPDFAREPPAGAIFAALVSPNGRGGGIYRSDDAGRSWHPSTQGLGDWVVAEISVAPGFPINNTVFALTWQGGLFRSTDGGQTWHRTNYPASPPVAMNVQALAISPDFVNDQTLVASSGQTASISRDGGDNWWTLFDDRATTLAFSPNYAHDRTLMGSFTNVGVLRSQDGGATWQAASRGLRFDSGSRVTLALSPDFARDPLAGAAFALVQSYERSTVYRTTDAGVSWQIESSGAAGSARINTLAVSPDLVFLGLDDARLRTVKANDLKWSSAPASLDKLNVESIALSPDYADDRTVFIGSGRAGVFVSTDGGKRWQETNFAARDTGAGRLCLALSPGYADDRVVFASAGGQVFRSDDGGATWQILASGLGSFFPASALAVSPQFTDDRTVLVGGGYRAPRVMRSTDAGQTWNPVSGLGENNGILALTFMPGDGRVAYAWADQAGLYGSGDGGATWTRVFSPTLETGWGVQSLALSPDYLHDRLMFLGVVGPGNLRRSADGGATWHPVDAGLPPKLIWGSALATSPDWTRDRLIYLGTDKGVFRSDDGGMTWKASSAGLPQAGVLSLGLSPGQAPDYTLFAGLVDRGLYVSPDGGTTWQPAR